jgi:hypothetical protein
LQRRRAVFFKSFLKGHLIAVDIDSRARRKKLAIQRATA